MLYIYRYLMPFYGWVMLHYTEIPHFVYVFIKHLSCLRLLATVNNRVINTYKGSVPNSTVGRLVFFSSSVSPSKAPTPAVSFQFNSVLTRSTLPYLQVPQVNGSVLPDGSPAPTSDTDGTQQGYYLCLRPAAFGFHVSTTTLLGSINMPEQLIEVTETFYSLDFNSETAIWKRCTGQGPELPYLLHAWHSPQISTGSPTWELSEPSPLEFLMRLPYIRRLIKSRATGDWFHLEPLSPPQRSEGWDWNFWSSHHRVGFLITSPSSSATSLT